MIRLLKTIVGQLNFIQAARRYIGGTWYLVEDMSFQGGMQGGIVYWTQDPGDHKDQVVKHEEWPVKAITKNSSNVRR